MDVSTLANIGELNATVFNDKKEERPIFKREYMVLLEVEAIFGVAWNQFTIEQRKWDGKTPLSANANSRKRRTTFMSKETVDACHSTTVFDSNLKFKGSNVITGVTPSPNCKLHPFNATNRTIIG